MRVWFLKESKSVCTSCATGCNIVIGSREDKVYRYEPRENDAVNSCWMCDYGRLNYKWINRDDRLDDACEARSSERQSRDAAPGRGWPSVRSRRFCAEPRPAPSPSSPPRARPTRSFTC